jgi:hypothetical protein
MLFSGSFCCEICGDPAVDGTELCRRRFSFLALPEGAMSQIFGVPGMESQMKSAMERYPIYRRHLVGATLLLFTF